MKEIIEAFNARIRSPVFGYFVLALLVINWKPLFFLLVDDTPVSTRIELFEKLTNITSLLVLPIAIGAIAAIVSPWVNYVFLRLCRKPTDLRNAIQAESEHKLLLKKKELEEARSLVLAAKERDLISRAKRDEEIGSLADEGARIELQKQIDQLRKELDSRGDIDKPFPRSAGDGGDLQATARQLADLLQRSGREEEAAEILRRAIERG